MKRFFVTLKMTLILSPARHSDERSKEESHCVTGYKLTFHRHEKILHFVQNDDIIIQHSKKIFRLLAVAQNDNI
ncbi:MAG: hypothetical protein N4A43_03530 [Alphaproteobacteria bacterium]|nr:hypothetical protein [Alphaproteobacteria bacterium]